MLSAKLLLPCLLLFSSVVALPSGKNTNTKGNKNTQSRRKHGMKELNADPDDNISVFHTSSQQQLDSYNQVYYFDQLIDHNEPSKGTFKQRYWHNWEYYEKGGPIVLMTPGEQSADGFSGFLTPAAIPGELSKRLNGSSIVLEHRFFGKSNPYNNLTVESLQVHTIQQAIDDLDYFAKNVKLPQPDGDSVAPGKAPWIFVGGSYPGALVSYAMYNKPDLFWAGWSSSGVVQSIADFWGYFEIIRQSIPQNCSSDIVSAINYIDSVFESGDDKAIWAIKQNFGLGDIEFADDFAAALFQYGGLYDWQEETEPAFAFCDVLEVDGNKVAPASGWGLHHTLQVWGKYWNETLFESVCGNSTTANDCLGQLHNANLRWNDPALDDGRSWEWMVCNEFGFFMTGAPMDKPSLVSRAYDVATLERTCGFRFPGAFNGVRGSSVLHSLGVNTAYGGWNVTTERVVFVNGKIDPWRETTMGADGANPSWNSALQPHLMHEAGHVADLYLSSGNTPTMKKVQQAGIEAVVGWMAEWKPTAS